MGPGGAEGTRTPYLNTASVALSRMSYSPRTTRGGFDPLCGPLTEATRRRLAESSDSPSRLTGEFDPGYRLAPPGGSLAKGVYYSRSQPLKNSRDAPRMPNLVSLFLAVTDHLLDTSHAGHVNGQLFLEGKCS